MTSPSNDRSAIGQCPICAANTAKDYAPFCCKRCANVDLHRWLSGSYAIPAVESEGDGEEVSKSS